jgi:hypothetical protein
VQFVQNPIPAMFIDLNVPFAPTGFSSNVQHTAKQKQKQKQKQKATNPSSEAANMPTLSTSDLDSINSRLDLITHRELDRSSLASLYID